MLMDPQPAKPYVVSPSSPPSSSAAAGPHKRRRKTHAAGAGPAPATAAAPDADSPPAASKHSPGSSGGGSGLGGSSAFRNVSACNRCRLRKNRCDQRLPACLSCEKAGVKCVGYDPITKREIPRSYVHYLETRVSYLEAQLQAHAVPFAPADAFPDLPVPQVQPTPPPFASPQPAPLPPIDPALAAEPRGSPPAPVKQEPDALEDTKLDSLVSDIGLVSFAGASDPRYLGSVSGISFARVVFAAVKGSAAQTEPANGGDAKARFRAGRRTRGLGLGSVQPRDDDQAPHAEEEDLQMRDSFFGLHTRPTISPAPFPSRSMAERLVDLYFEHANPQTPILHRGEFRKVLDTIYAPAEAHYNGDAPEDYGVDGSELGGSARERYLLNIVCAIGAGIFLTGPDGADGSDAEKGSHTQETPRKKRKRESIAVDGKEKRQKHEPESYHASAMQHLEAFLAQSKGGLEELQAVLLLASYALLRPVSPGLWYIVGVALRLAVDLGLHYEDTESQKKAAAAIPDVKTAREGRKEWVRDMRRRLWWCVYSLDRLVSTCVGRPFGIADEVVSTQFPSLCDDEYIDPVNGINPPPGAAQSYKVVSHHYFRLRLLQSEILQVLQQQSNSFSSSPSSTSETYPAHHPYHLKTPYLHKFPSIRAWHRDVDRRLKEWRESAPRSKSETGVAFTLEFLDLNYWQTKIMLYRPCLSVPVLLAGELGTSGLRARAAERGLGGKPTGNGDKEEEERVYMIVAEAGSKVLRLYRHLHRVHQVNYTFLATHHLFMAGISFLYAIWHSPAVRAQLSMDDVDFTILAATSVLGDLVDKCPPAEACKEAFERMSRATVQMCMAGKRAAPGAIGQRHQTGLRDATGTAATPPAEDDEEEFAYPAIPAPQQQRQQQQQQQRQRQQQQQQQQQQQRQWHQMPAAVAPPTPAYPPQQNRRVSKHNIHFDEGFNELLAPARSPVPRPTPPPPYRPACSQPFISPETNYGTSLPSPSYAYQQPPQQQQQPQHGHEPMIDPALGGGGADSHTYWGEGWEALGMPGFGNLGGDNWGEGDGDAWSEGGGTSGGGVDLFDGFFFGGGGT